MRLRFNAKERDLIQDLTLDESGVARALESTEPISGVYEVECSLDDLDHLMNSIAADANHADNPKKETALDGLFERLGRIQDKYDDAL